MRLLYRLKKGGERHSVATFGSNKQLLTHVRWATLKNLDEYCGKFVQCSDLASCAAWEH